MNMMKLQIMFVTEVLLLLTTVNLVTSTQSEYSQPVNDESIYRRSTYSQPTQVAYAQPVYYVQPNQFQLYNKINANPEIRTLEDYYKQLMMDQQLNNLYQQQLQAYYQQQYPQLANEPQSTLGILSRPMISLPTYVLRVSKMYLPQMRKQSQTDGWFQSTKLPHQQAERARELLVKFGKSSNEKPSSQLSSVPSHSTIGKLQKVSNSKKNNNKIPNIEGQVQRLLRDSKPFTSSNKLKSFLENSTISKNNFTAERILNSNDEIRNQNNVKRRQLLDSLQNLLFNRQNSTESTIQKVTIANLPHSTLSNKSEYGNTQNDLQINSASKDEKNADIIHRKSKAATNPNMTKLLNSHETWSNSFMNKAMNDYKYNFSIPAIYNSNLDHISSQTNQNSSVQHVNS